MTLKNNMGIIVGLSPEVNDRISDICSFKVQGAEKSELYRKRRWDGRKRLYAKAKGEFPMGLWYRIAEFLEEHKIEFRVTDERTITTNDLPDAELTEGVEEREYQLEAVQRAITSKRSVIQVATGGGKTVIASLIIQRLKCTTLFVVHTKDLLYQTKKSFEEMLGGVGTIGQMGDGIIDIQPITVATTQTISKFLNVKYEKYKYDDSDDKEETTDTGKYGKDIGKFLSNVQLLLWDEVHRVACDMALGVSNAITNAPIRVGLSASPWRDDGADLMIEAAMGHVSYKINASQLIEMGYLVPPIIQRVKVKATIPHDRDTRTYDQIYKAEIVENAARNELILKYAADFMELNMPSLILVQQIKHGTKLKRMISEQYHPIDFLSGRDLSFTRNQTIQEMRDGERISLIASTIADEGLDIKRLAGLIMAGGGKSSTRALQRVGRVLRTFEGKTHALIVDFDDEAKYLRDHSQKRKEIFSTEPSFTILEL